MPEVDLNIPKYRFLEGGGNMAQLVADYNWEATSLGSVDQWPPSLRNTLSLILRSRFPMFLFWGPDLLCFYNDAYVPTFGENGKHPIALGMAGKDVWNEIWDVLEPLIDSVLAGEGASWVEDQKLMLLRNGGLEETYWTYSYSPVIDESGVARGVFCVTSETTKQVITLKQVEESRQSLREMILLSPAAMCILRGRELIVEIANDKMFELWGKPAQEFLNRPVFVGLPEAREQGLEVILNDVFTTGETYTANERPLQLPRNGKMETVYVNFSYQAVREGDGNIWGILAVAIDVTEQVKARNAIEQSEKRFRAVLEAIDQMTWTNTPDGEINFYNQTWYDYTGLSVEETQAVGWQGVVHPDDLEMTLKTYRAGLESGELIEIENRYLRWDGMYRWHLNRALPVRNEEGEIEFWVGTATDIEDIKRLQQQKDDFLGIASHELKTPLTSANAYMQIINKSLPDDHKLKRFIQNGLKQLNRLERLTADLLDVSKINSGKLPYEYSTFNFAKLLNDAVSSIQQTVTSHSLIIKESVDFNVSGDYQRLEQVLNNFISNAVKYSPGADKVIIRSRVIQNQLVVSIQDFGIGIPENKVNKLFERFYRIEDTAMRFQGLGLGLFIVSEILQRHRGRFWIESILGKGSTFYFMLPPIEDATYSTQTSETMESYIDEHISIQVNKAEDIIEVDWKGFQDFESVTRGCLKMLEILKQNGCKKVLNDNRNVLGTWSDAAEWAGKEWFPMMEKVGLTHFAWIYSHSTFSQLSANKSADVKSGTVNVHFFYDEEEARTWLKNSEL